jgi:hypothetical protein
MATISTSALFTACSCPMAWTSIGTREARLVLVVSEVCDGGWHAREGRKML